MFVSGGALVSVKTPLSLTGSDWFFRPFPPMASHGWPSAYAGIYERQLWVYVVVIKRARATARLPLPVYLRDDLNRPRADDHPMAALLRSPNPGLSGFDLWLWTSATFDIFGEAFWLKRRRGGRVSELVPLHPTSMRFEDESWSFDNGKTRIADIRRSDLVHFRDFHPTNLDRGMSPLEPLRATLENEWSARVATSSFWQRGARPGTALTHPGVLSEAAQSRVKAQFEEAAGGAGRTGATVVLEEGMVPKSLTLTAEEAQYIETRKLNREEVCAAYDVPPPVVHILDRATFSNITEQMRSMYRDTMAPHLQGFEATIERDLRSVEWPSDDVYAEFLMDHVLRGDFESRQDALAKATHMTIAEKRKIENLPFIEGTDRIFLNTATLPLDAIDAQAAALTAQTGALPAAEDEPSVPLSVVRSVLGRLSWQRSLGQVDPKALASGLSDAEARTVGRAVAEEVAVGGTVAGLRKRLAALTAVKAVTKAPDVDGHAARVRDVLRAFFATQADAVRASGSMDPAEWDDALAGDLHDVAVLVSAAVGRGAVRDLGFDPETYDVDRTVEFLRAVAERVAGNVNATTATQFEADPDAAFGDAVEARASGIGTGLATMVAGFAVVEAGRRIAEAGRTPRKTWNTGANPRSTHAALNGETVPVDEPFSNGMQWPGESGDPDETAGCNCTVTLEV